MPLQTLAIFFLGMLAAGGVAYVFIYPILSGERQAEKRQAVVARPEPGARLPSAARGQPKSRRDQVEESLKELELRQKNVSKPPLSLRIQQAGLGWSKRQFFLISAGIGTGFFVLGMFGGMGLLVSLLLGFAGAFGVPRWLLSFWKKRRQSKFLSNFPDAVDVIVRGIKAGLPLGDCIRIIAAEAPEPVRTEFKSIVETQAIGMPLGEACGKLHERMHLPEANFFGIVVAIQSKSGGNLSEALGNLSRVLRDRKRMAAKIQAMSMEAKASAVIIAALPFAVMILVYITSPSYIELLWTTPMGRMMMAACVVWMLIGTMVMKKMINFDF
jgi:tight adherence protein B